MDWLACTLLRLRFAISLAVTLVAFALWYVYQPIQFNQTIEGFFPPSDPDLRNYERIKQAFGGDDFVFAVYHDEQLFTAEGMSRVHTLATAIRQNVPGVARVESIDQMPLPWKIDAAVESLLGMSVTARALNLPRLVAALTIVEAEVQAAQQQPADLANLREKVCSHPLFRDLLVDRHGVTNAVVVRLRPPSEIDHKKSVLALRGEADAFGAAHGLDRVALVGPPVLLAEGFISLERDNRRLGTLAMALMALTMLVVVRSPWWALLPLVSGGATWLIAAALLNALDLQLTLSAGPIIAQTIVLCMPAASHLAMRFREAAEVESDRRSAAIQALKHVFVPVMWCTLTAAAGYLALVSSTIQPVFQFGITMAACNIVAGILVYALAPFAMCPPGIRPTTQPSQVRGAIQVGRMTAWVLQHPGRTLAVFVAPCILVAFGTTRLEFQSNYIKIYRSQSRIVQDYHYVEERMGGIGLVEILVPAPHDPKSITPAWLDSLEEATAAARANHPEIVGEALSLANVLTSDQRDDTAAATELSSDKPPEKTTRRPGILGGLLGRPSSTPATPEQVIQTKLTVLGMPGFSHFLENFWDRPTGQTRLLIRVRESANAAAKQRTFDRLLQDARNRFGPDCTISGLSYLMTQVTRAIVRTQFQSTAWSCGVILVMLVLALRSVTQGVLALLPTLLAVGLVLGVMGWLSVKVDLSTALVASVAVGLSVDDTFHCLLRWKRELRAGRSRDEALRVSYAGAGPGVVLSSAAVSLGFLALISSEFVPTANFGWLVAVATLGGSLGNLVVLPACLSWRGRIQ